MPSEAHAFVSRTLSREYQAHLETKRRRKEKALTELMETTTYLLGEGKKVHRLKNQRTTRCRMNNLCYVCQVRNTLDPRTLDNHSLMKGYAEFLHGQGK